MVVGVDQQDFYAHIMVGSEPCDVIHEPGAASRAALGTSEMLSLANNHNGQWHYCEVHRFRMEIAVAFRATLNPYSE